jgi:hypothetical protein
MPTTRIRVWNVAGPYHVGQRPPYLTKFDVNADDAQYGTFDPFVASLCEQAGKQKFLVEVTWRDTRYGREIVRGGARKSEEAA